MQEGFDPIEGYSKEMGQLVENLLIKDEKKRPRIMEIINYPFVKQHMQAFAKSNGTSNLNPNLQRKKTI